MIRMKNLFDYFEYIETLQLDNKKMLLILLGCITVIYIDVAFLMKLQLQGIKAASVKSVQLKKDIDALSRELIQLQRDDLKSEKQLKPKKLVEEEQLPSLLQDIYAIANSNRVNVIQIKPTKEAKSKDSKAKAPGAGKGEEKPGSVLIALEVSGDYHRFGYFVNSLENAEYFIAVEEIKITQSSSDSLQQKASILLRAYVNK